MGFDAKAGMFALNVVPGNQAIEGVGFAPKVVLFFPTDNTTDGVAVHAHQGFGLGISSTERFALAADDENGQNPTDTHRESNTGLCIIHNVPGSGAADYEADFVSLNPDGFTIDITDAPAAAKRVGYLALGGSDLTNVKAGDFEADNALGTQPVAGIGFQPDAVIFASISGTNPITSGSHAPFSLGFAVSPTEQGTLGVGSIEGAGASNTGRQQRTVSCIVILNSVGGMIGEAHLESFDADGFTLDWIDAIDRDIFYLCLKGGEYSVGSLLTQTALGGFSETGIGFLGRAGLFASFCNAADGGKVDGWEMSVGVATSSSERIVAGSVSEDGQTPSDADSFQDSGLIYLKYDYEQNVEGAIDFVSWDNDGFTLNQTDADKSANQMIYLVMGVPPSVEGYTWIF